MEATVFSGSSTTFSVTASGVGTWSHGAQQVASTGTIQVLYAKVSSSGSPTITLSSTAGGGVHFIVTEYSGLASSSPFVQDNGTPSGLTATLTATAGNLLVPTSYGVGGSPGAPTMSSGTISGGVLDDNTTYGGVMSIAVGGSVTMTVTSTGFSTGAILTEFAAASSGGGLLSFIDSVEPLQRRGPRAAPQQILAFPIDDVIALTVGAFPPGDAEIHRPRPPRPPPPPPPLVVVGQPTLVNPRAQLYLTDPPRSRREPPPPQPTLAVVGQAFTFAPSAWAGWNSTPPPWRSPYPYSLPNLGFVGSPLSTGALPGALAPVDVPARPFAPRWLPDSWSPTPAMTFAPSAWAGWDVISQWRSPRAPLQLADGVVLEALPMMLFGALPAVDAGVSPARPSASLDLGFVGSPMTFAPSAWAGWATDQGVPARFPAPAPPLAVVGQALTFAPSPWLDWGWSPPSSPRRLLAVDLPTPFQATLNAFLPGPIATPEWQSGPTIRPFAGPERFVLDALVLPTLGGFLAPVDVQASPRPGAPPQPLAVPATAAQALVVGGFPHAPTPTFPARQPPAQVPAGVVLEATTTIALAPIIFGDEPMTTTRRWASVDLSLPMPAGLFGFLSPFVAGPEVQWRPTAPKAAPDLGGPLPPANTYALRAFLQGPDASPSPWRPAALPDLGLPIGRLFGFLPPFVPSHEVQWTRRPSATPDLGVPPGGLGGFLLPALAPMDSWAARGAARPELGQQPLPGLGATLLPFMPWLDVQVAPVRRPTIEASQAPMTPRTVLGLGVFLPWLLLFPQAPRSRPVPSIDVLFALAQSIATGLVFEVDGSFYLAAQAGSVVYPATTSESSLSPIVNVESKLELIAI